VYLVIWYFNVALVNLQSPRAATLKPMIEIKSIDFSFLLLYCFIFEQYLRY